MTYLGFVTLVGNCQIWVEFCQIWVRSGFVKYGRQDLSHMGGTEGINWFFGICQIWVGFCQIWVGSGFVKYGRQDLSQMGGTEGRNWFKRRARLRSPTV